MFIVAERDSVRHRLLELAAADPSVAAAATTGSYAVGGVDEWSDIDLAFGIRDAIPAALARWTELLYRDFGAVHHWDLPSGSSIYRVFLTASWLEVDIAFTPVTEFGPLGPSWQTVFGEAVALVPSASPRLDDLVGRAWHHALHANASIERGRAWQAEYWISGVRDQVVALACVRLGQTTWYARGAHLLPPEVIESLAAALVRSLDELELRRALAAAAEALVSELRKSDMALADRLGPMLREICRPP